MLRHFNFVIPTIYIGDSELFLENNSTMEFLDDFNMNDIHPDLNLEIKSDGTNTETNFKIKRYKTRNHKDNKEHKSINIINKDEENKIIKKKQLLIKERRDKNRLSAQKCRENKRLKLEEAIKLIEELKIDSLFKNIKLQKLKKELEDKNIKLQKLKTFINE
jgi:hypothetical protein